jgi:hypothetical protein
MPNIKQRTLPFLFFPIHYTVINLACDASTADSVVKLVINAYVKLHSHENLISYKIYLVRLILHCYNRRLKLMSFYGKRKRHLFLSHYVYKLSGDRYSHHYAVRGKTHIRVTRTNFRLLLCRTVGHYWVFSPHFVVKLPCYRSKSGNITQQATKTSFP